MNRTPTLSSSRKQRSSLRTLAVGFCLTLVLLAASLGFAQPASAASSVTYCFKYSTGGAAYANSPTVLQVYTTSGWQGIASGTTFVDGCGSFTMGGYSNYYARVGAVKTVFSNGVAVSGWVGVTPVNATPGASQQWLGWGLVNCTWGCPKWNMF